MPPDPSTSGEFADFDASDPKWDAIAALSAFMQDTSTTSSLRTIPPDPSTSGKFAEFDASDPKRAFGHVAQ